MSLIQELDHLQISLHGVENHINYEMDDGMESGPSGDGCHNKQRSSEEHHEPDHSLTKEITEGTEPKLPADDSEDDDTSGEDDTESSDDEEEERKAPVEMLGEFLIYVRTADWENAAKLCKMILIYEPNNSQALQFQSVIAEKVQVEKDLAEMSSSSEEESTDEEESEDDEEGDAEKSEDSNNEDDDDDNDEEPERSQSQMKNRLLFPSDNKIWKP